MAFENTDAYCSKHECARKQCTCSYNPKEKTEPIFGRKPEYQKKPDIVDRIMDRQTGSPPGSKE